MSDAIGGLLYVVGEGSRCLGGPRPFGESLFGRPSLDPPLLPQAGGPGICLGHPRSPVVSVGLGAARCSELWAVHPRPGERSPRCRCSGWSRPGPGPPEPLLVLRSPCPDSAVQLLGIDPEKYSQLGQAQGAGAVIAAVLKTASHLVFISASLKNFYKKGEK